MKPNNSTSIDVIGPPVNMCAKINHKAQSNGVVIGGDLFQMVKDLSDYRFTSISGLSIGLKYTYPIYSLTRRKQV
jgi:class 3 adenylate cyclase